VSHHEPWDEHSRRHRWELPDPAAVECAECARAVSEVEAIAEGWRYWSDGRDLRPFCPDCARYEFGHVDGRGE
jgi:hypothetical protein